MGNRAVYVLIAVVTVAAIGLLWGSSIPLGVPSEWEWNRIQYPGGLGAVMIESALALIVSIFLIGYAWLGLRRIERCSGAERFGWLIGLVAIGVAWMISVQESTPPTYRMTKAAWVLYYPGASGYYFNARYDYPNTDEFLGGYEDRMKEGDYLHVGTHPPGLFVVYRGIINFLNGNPAAVEAVLQTQTESFSAAFDVIEENNRASRGLKPEDRATIWLAVLLTHLVAALTVIPLFALLRQEFSAQTAWASICFWPAIPSICIFLPKSDALYPLIAATFIYFWVKGFRDRSWSEFLIAGLVAWLGMFFSLAMLPTLAVAGLLTLIHLKKLVESERSENNPDADDATQKPSPSLWSGPLKAIAFAVAGFIAPCLVLLFVWKINLAAVWYYNFINHESFYDAFERTYAKWLGVNAIEIMIAMGGPLGVLAVSSTWTKSALTRSKASDFQGVWPCLAVWMLLWLSGKNNGEAARLWIILLPGAIWMAAYRLDAMFEEADSDKETKPHPLAAWFCLLILQAFVCVATTMRVTGFSLPGPVEWLKRLDEIF
ncbi:MAG: hypothetical protein CMJ78_05245 [Planctomycetaceae bacterium]|nr:hypothetical protein [Planctomycetaceae bacterium]